MPFHIQPLREFLVRPSLPGSLSAHDRAGLQHPVELGAHHPRALSAAGSRHCGASAAIIRSSCWAAFRRPRWRRPPPIRATWRCTALACEPTTRACAKAPPPADGKLIAYFSAEYGLTECLPVYSGGLGILSGDHLKSSSDQDYPLVGLGLLYQQGYFRQFLNPDGWQQERYPMNDFYTLPLEPVKDAEGHDLKVTVKLPTGNVFIQVWKLDVGRITLYLLDTNIPDNVLPQDRDITDSLYGGDIDTRIRQEIVLGIGGMRALQGDGAQAHRLPHERRPLGLPRAGADPALHARRTSSTSTKPWKRSRASNVFTTHTPVPAGIDLFDPGLMYHYFSEYCAEVGIDFQQLMALGRRNVYNRDERFSMAVLALNTSSYRNAVSRLHREVSQEMFHDLWPQLPRVGSADHLDHQRRAPAELAERRPGRCSTISTWSPTGASASTIPPSGSRSTTFRTRSCSKCTAAASAAWSPSCARASMPRAAAPPGVRGRSPARQRSARSERVHHRLRAPLRHLQARHADLPRRRAAQADSVQ